jgi:hypothetical protein
MIDASEIARLRAIANAATPGPWRIYTCTTIVGDERGGQWVHGADPYADQVASEILARDAAFVVAFDPPTVLALLDLIESQRAEIERVRKAVDKASVELSRTRVAANMERERLTKERDEARIKALSSVLIGARGVHCRATIEARIAELRAGAGEVGS